MLFVWYHLYNTKTWKTPMEECYFWLKVAAFHGCFLCFLNYTNWTKSHNASQLFWKSWQNISVKLRILHTFWAIFQVSVVCKIFGTAIFQNTLLTTSVIVNLIHIFIACLDPEWCAIMVYHYHGYWFWNTYEQAWQKCFCHVSTM